MGVEEAPPATFEDDSKGVSIGFDPEASEKATFFCGATKADDTPCEREVDAPDETCWQHPAEDE